MRKIRSEEQKKLRYEKINKIINDENFVETGDLDEMFIESPYSHNSDELEEIAEQAIDNIIRRYFNLH